MPTENSHTSARPGVSTPSPQASTTPATSIPSVKGGAGMSWYSPRIISKSAKFRPAGPDLQAHLARFGLGKWQFGQGGGLIVGQGLVGAQGEPSLNFWI